MEALFIRLMVRLAVAASLASVFVRFKSFQRLLIREDRTLKERMQLALWFGLMVGSEVLLRVRSRSYEFVDLGMEGCLLAGLIGGYVPGFVAGVLISIPAMIHSEFATLPFLAAVGLFGGMVRDFAADKEYIWGASPLFDMHLVEAFTKGRDFSRPLFNGALLGAIVIAEFLRELVAGIFHGKRLFSLWPAPEHQRWYVILAVYASVYLAVTLPIKVWNNARNEMKLERQNQLLLQARLQALMNQINPHFLFNTLNSVATLIRIDPPRARQMIVRLSNLLRRQFRKHESLTTLREELEFVDDYLAIEMARFGDKLRFERQVEAGSLDCMVPSMLLQPLVENSVRHGLGGKVEGGTVKISAELGGGSLRVCVEDDGVGIAEGRVATLLQSGAGIGVSNVNERLKVLFGPNSSMTIESEPGKGTRIVINIPEQVLAKAS